MKNNKNLKQIINILLLAVMFVGLPVALVVMQKNQDIRNRAAGSGEINLMLTPTNGNYTYSPGNTFDVNLKIANTTQTQITVSGIEANITIPGQLTVNPATISCLTPFNGLSHTNIIGNTVYIKCAIGATATPPSITSLGVLTAKISFTVAANAAPGPAPLTFSDTRVSKTVPAGQSGPVPDISTAGETANFTIVALTPTPTTTIPTATPTSVPSVTIEPTSAPFVSCNLSSSKSSFKTSENITVNYSGGRNVADSLQIFLAERNGVKIIPIPSVNPPGSAYPTEHGSSSIQAGYFYLMNLCGLPSTSCNQSFTLSAVPPGTYNLYCSYSTYYSNSPRCNGSPRCIINGGDINCKDFLPCSTDSAYPDSITLVVSP